MSQRALSVFLLLAVVSIPVQADPVATVSTTYGKLPLRFESNRGQTDSRARFIARGAGYTLFLTRDEAVLRLRGAASEAGRVIAMRLVGAAAREPVGQDPQAGRTSYLIGNDPERWRNDVPAWSKVTYANVYRGIDLVYHGQQRQLEYDFVVAPGADPRRIEMAFRGVDRLSLDRDGNLVLTTGGRPVTFRKPDVYQEIDGRRAPVDGSYAVRGNRVRFRVGAYDRTRTLVIDPVLVYSTFLGGNTGDAAWGIAVDAAGSAYVVGNAGSADFPLEGPINSSSSSPYWDAFVAKLSPAGDALVYSTFIGGRYDDYGQGVAVDSAGNVYVAGTTGSPDFPLENEVHGYAGNGDAFVVKLNATGTAIVYSTVLGGSHGDYGRGVALGADGSAVVIGTTTSDCVSGDPLQTPFPTKNAYQWNLAGSAGGNSDLFVAKLAPAGGSLVFSTYFGGSNIEPDSDLFRAVAVDSSGDVWITGQTCSSNFPTATPLQSAFGGYCDAIVARFSGAGALEYSTYLGGSAEDGGRAIAVDANGNAYVTGYTCSTNFPTANAYKPTSNVSCSYGDAFVSKINAAGTALVYSTYLGGEYGDAGLGIAVDADGGAYVVGIGWWDLSPQVDALPGNSSGSVFVTHLSPAGSAVLYSTFIGAGTEYGCGIALDGDRNAYITGYTGSHTYPTTPGAFQPEIAGGQDAFISKISPLVETTTTVTSSANPALVGTSITLTATVTGARVSGTVQFRDGNTALGAPVTLSGGKATLVRDDLKVGKRPITATYGGGDVYLPSTSESFLQTVLAPFGAPPGFNATASSAGTVTLAWNAVADAHHYEVARRARINEALVVSKTVFATNDSDTGLQAGTTYLYNVRAVDRNGVISAWSVTDPATTILFTDALLAAGTPVRAAHLTELRTAVNAMRVAANLPPVAFTDPSVGTSTPIRAVHLQELRDGLHQARTALSLPSPGYTDALNVRTTPVRAVHVQELRERTW